jgi:hypothetical protein
MVFCPAFNILADQGDQFFECITGGGWNIGSVRHTRNQKSTNNADTSIIVSSRNIQSNSISMEENGNYPLTP